jgi:hypothetical protein
MGVTDTYESITLFCVVLEGASITTNSKQPSRFYWYHFFGDRASCPQNPTAPAARVAGACAVPVQNG